MKLKDLAEKGLLELPPARFTTYNDKEHNKYVIDYCEGFNRALELVADIDINIEELRRLLI